MNENSDITIDENFKILMRIKGKIKEAISNSDQSLTLNGEEISIIEKAIDYSTYEWWE